MIAALERHAELACAVVADRRGDFHDGEIGLAQQLGGAADAVFEQILVQRTAVGLPEAVLERSRGNMKPRGKLIDGERVGEMRQHMVAHLPHQLDLIAVAAGRFGRKRQQRTVRAQQIEQLGGFEGAVASACLGLQRLERGKDGFRPGRAAQQGAAAPGVQPLFKPHRVERQAAEQRAEHVLKAVVPAHLDHNESAGEPSVRHRGTGERRTPATDSPIPATMAPIILGRRMFIIST